MRKILYDRYLGKTITFRIKTSTPQGVPPQESLRFMCDNPPKLGQFQGFDGLLCKAA